MPHHDRPNVFLPRIGNITSGTLGVKSAIVSGPLRWRALTVALYSETLLLQPAKLNAMIPGLFRLFSVCVYTMRACFSKQLVWTAAATTGTLSTETRGSVVPSGVATHCMVAERW